MKWSPGRLSTVWFAFLSLMLGSGAAVPVQSNFSNIQVLTDMTDREIQLAMQDWSRQLGVTCFECHIRGDFASDAVEFKRTARMMAMAVRALNETPFFRQSLREADCFLCHRGTPEIPEAP